MERASPSLPYSLALPLRRPCCRGPKCKPCVPDRSVHLHPQGRGEKFKDSDGLVSFCLLLTSIPASNDVRINNKATPSDPKTQKLPPPSFDEMELLWFLDISSKFDFPSQLTMCQVEDRVRPTLVRPENLFRARPPEGRGFPAYESGYPTRRLARL